MIRRAVWLVVGAVLGVAGYRRLTRTMRAIMPPASRPGSRRQLMSPLRPGQQAGLRPRHQPREFTAPATFLRDVRTGMAEYLDRHRDEI